jgi:heat shock protein HtpX
MMNMLRTVLLFALLTGIFLGVGFLLGGTFGMTIALIFAFIMNFISYWYSDKIVLSIYRAKEVSFNQNPELHKIVERVAKNAKIPKPKVYFVNTDIPNAFATGRSIKHAAIAVTRGILNLMDEDELEAVISHEIAHVKNRDTLTSTIAATIGGALAYLAQIAWFSIIFGNRNERGGSLLLFPLLIFAPLAATLIQLAISRTREYKADYDGAIISKKPLSLASALEKIENSVSRIRLEGNPATGSLFIVNPFRGDSFVNLFSTHPSTEDRIRKLRELASKIK